MRRDYTALMRLTTVCVAMAVGCGGRVAAEADPVDAPQEEVASGWETSVADTVDPEFDSADAPVADVAAETAPTIAWDGPADRCLTGGNLAYLEGDPGDFIHPGSATIAGAKWESVATSPSYVDVARRPITDEDSWTFEFATVSSTPATPLAVGVYEGATRAAFRLPGTPGLQVSGDGRGCNRLSGRFRIHAIDFREGRLKLLTATFEQRCQDVSGTLRGCVHFEVPPDTGPKPK